MKAIRIAFLVCISTQALCQFTTTAPEVNITEKDGKEMVESLGSVIETGYFSAEKGREVKVLLLKNLKDKKYKSFTTARSLIEQLGRDVQSVIHDGHFNILFFPNDAANFSWSSEGQDENPEEKKKQELATFERFKQIAFGLPKIEILDGNVGYLKVSRFDSPERLFRQPVADAMNFLRHTDALIVDVRNNPGGLQESVRLLESYFFDGPPVLLSTTYSRSKNTSTPLYTETVLIGERYIGKKVYVLTSKSTASGGEKFAYDLKHFKNATIVGETTKGSAHSFNTVKIGPERIGNIMVLLPDEYVVQAVTKKDWEGEGAVSDVPVSAAEALHEGYVLALKELSLSAVDEIRKRNYEQLIASVVYRHKSDNQPPLNLTDYTGKYGIRSIFAEGDELLLQREGGSKIKMVAIGEDTFELDVAMSPKPVVKFKRDNGKVTALLLSGIGADTEVKKEN